MAKRKKPVKRTKSRRRKMSGVGKLDLTNIALVVGGAVASNILTNQLSKSSNTTLQKVAPFVGLGAGIVLPMFIKSQTIAQLSLGLVAGGGVAALGQNGLKVIGFMDNAIAYPGGYKSLPYRQVAGLANGQGLAKGTHSNFSGSRQSQINTIAGLSGFDLGSGAANPYN